MADEATSAVITLMLAACGLSLAALAYLFQKHIDGQSLLAYQPRRRVPWGPVAAFIAMAMPLLSVATFFIGDTQSVGDKGPASKDVSTESLLIMGWGNFTFMVLLVVGGLAWLVTFFRADAHDLGLPTSWKQLAHDVGLGIFATIAALLPIYAIQLTLINAFQSETQHPLVKQLEEHNSPQMLLLGFAMAVIAAPLFEEFTFRGLLQGWLERREDEILGFAGTERHPTIEALAANVQSPVETPIEQRDDETDGDEFADGKIDNGYVVEAVIPIVDANPIPEVPAADVPPPDAAARPSHGWIPDLPHGWTPILMSGVAFGLAHIGHGVAPISLILFGIVLGYLYQRTHRLVPSITAHMLFNFYSMVLLWLQLKPSH